MFAPLATDLKLWWINEGRKLPEKDQWIEIQSKFGDRIAREVCTPYSLTITEAIVGAIEVAREPLDSPVTARREGNHTGTAL
jgi:hypothetical protein